MGKKVSIGTVPPIKPLHQHPNSAIGEQGNIKGNSGCAGKYDFMPDKYDGAKGTNNPPSSGSSKTNTMKTYDFLPDKPE